VLYSVASQTQLLQWAFVNAKADVSFGQQSHEAERQFLAAWNYIQEEQRAVFEREMRAEALERELALHKSLKSRNGEISELGKHISDFQDSYVTLSRAVGESANKMPVKNVAVSDPEELASLLHECGELLRTIEGSQIDGIAGFSKSVGTLSNSVEETRRELAECCELIRQIEVAEKLERNLQIQQIQQVQEA